MAEIRLIDANALKEALEENRWYHTLPNGDLGEGANSKTTVPIYLADDVNQLIDNAPTIEKRPHGKWIYKQIHDYDYWECSNCGELCTEGTPKTMNFCPNCGADMRSDNDKRST